MVRLAASVLGLALVLAGAGCADEPDTEGSSSPATSASSAESSPSASESSPSSPETSPETSAAAGDKLAAYADAVEQQVEETYGDFNGLYSEIRVEPLRPGGLEYVYVFAKAVDPRVAVPAFRKQRRILRVAFQDQIAPELKRNGFRSSKVRWTYLNPDGSRIWRYVVS